MNYDGGIQEDLVESSVLLVSFGGINAGLGIPIFEFYKSLEAFKYDKVFIRDLNQAWYNLGIDGKYRSINSLNSYLKEVISKDYKKIIFLGNSMGGFAAIYFGVIHNVDKVVAFSPQTFIDKFHRFLYFDRRWRKEIKKIYESKLDFKILDLKHEIKRLKYKTQIDIYYGMNDRLDKVHARRLAKIDQVNLHAIEDQGHSLVKYLRDKGELRHIFEVTSNGRL